jgi:hypothetical protein
MPRVPPRKPPSHLTPFKRLPEFAKNGSRETPFSLGFLMRDGHRAVRLPFSAKNGNRLESPFGRSDEPSRTGAASAESKTDIVITSPPQCRSARGTYLQPLDRRAPCRPFRPRATFSPWRADRRRPMHDSPSQNASLIDRHLVRPSSSAARPDRSSPRQQGLAADRRCSPCSRSGLLSVGNGHP